MDKGNIACQRNEDKAKREDTEVYINILYKIYRYMCTYVRKVHAYVPMSFMITYDFY